MSIKKNFLALLKDENSQNVIIENAEAILDSVIDNDVIDSIPILGSLTSIGKAYMAFKDRQLIGKIGVFLKQLQNLSQEEINDFLDNEAQKPEEIGEKLLIILDRVETDDKAKVIGEIFAQYIQQKIIKDNFDILCHAVDRVYFFELHLLRHSYSNEYSMLDIGPLFLPFRITQQKFELIKHDPTAFWGEQKKPDHIKVTYQLTGLGKILVNILNKIYG